MTKEENQIEQRFAPAANHEIIELATQLKDDPEISNAFGRVGLHEDFTDEEKKLLDDAIEAFRAGDYWDRDILHFYLAESVLRRLFAGEFSGLSDPAVESYLDGRKVQRRGLGLATTQPTMNEILLVCRAMRKSPEMVKIAKEWDVELTGEQSWAVRCYGRNQEKKYGLLHRKDIAVAALSALRKIVFLGFPDTDQTFIDYFNTLPDFRALS